MATGLFATILKLAVHFAVVGSVLDAHIQIHHGHLQEAVVHTAVAAVCMLLAGLAGYIAIRMLGGKDSSIVTVSFDWAPKKKPRQTRQTSVKKERKTRKSRGKYSLKNK